MAARRASDGNRPVPSVLAIDIGRSGCRAALWDDDAAIPHATAAGAGSLGLGAANGPAVAAAAILAVAAPLLEARRGHRAVSLGIGIAGALGAPGPTQELARRLLAALPVAAVAVASDAISSHAGALAGEPGVVLAAGTGAVAIAIGAERRFRRVDGCGPWLGDEGSGAWLGRSGLMAVARAGDGRGPATALSAAMQKQFGSLEQLAGTLGCDANPARTLAAFAPAVAAAARAGDAVALQLVEACAATLARSTLAAARALDPQQPVAAAIIGGMAEIGAILLDPLRALLANSDIALQLQTAKGTSLDGARRLAIADDGIHAPWVTRVRRTRGAAHAPALPAH
jgi:N-acetylglucosamine kinase-like BadF-type ATPase